MHKEYADNKYSAINLYNNMVNLLCLSNVCRVQRQELVVELWRRSCVTLPWYTYNKYFKGFPGLNSVNTKVYRKVFNTKYQTFRSTPLKPMISSNNPTATDFRIHRLFHNSKFAIMEVINFSMQLMFFLLSKFVSFATNFNAKASESASSSLNV